MWEPQSRRRAEAWARVVFFDGSVLYVTTVLRDHGVNNWLLDGLACALIWYITGRVIRSAYETE